MRELRQVYPIKAPLPKETGQLFVCVKFNKRLFIQNTKTGKLLYTPPDFLRMVDRKSMQDLAEKSSRRGFMAVNDIIEFEENSTKK